MFLSQFSNQIHSDHHEGHQTRSDEAHTASRHSQGTYLGPLFRDLENITGARRSSMHKLLKSADKKTDHFPGIIDCKSAMWNSLQAGVIQLVRENLPLPSFIAFIRVPSVSQENGNKILDRPAGSGRPCAGNVSKSARTTTI